MSESRMPKIIVFSWNASGLRICKTAYGPDVEGRGKGFKGFITRQKPCVTPDFFRSVSEYISSKQPDIVVMSTQDEDESNTYFHSDYLPNIMKEVLGYELLRREKVTQVGVKAASGTAEGTVPTGDPSGSALRMSIYVKGSARNDYKLEEKRYRLRSGNLVALCPTGRAFSGAIAAYVIHPFYGKFAFVNIHLPRSDEVKRVGRDMSYDEFNANALSRKQLCMSKILESFIRKKNEVSREKIDNVIIMGDFGYDVYDPSGKASSGASSSSQYDQFRTVAMKQSPLNTYTEGIDGKGPLFAPTWQMARGRGPQCQNAPGKKVDRLSSECYSGVVSGWHDRIIFKSVGEFTGRKLRCIEYNRFDVGNIKESTHAAIYGEFSLE